MLLQEAVQFQSPQRAGMFRPKLRYAHQGGMNPPVIVVHGNSLEHVTEAYKRFLEGVVDEVSWLFEPHVSEDGHRLHVAEVLLVHDNGPDDSARVIRFANRVPLLFQQSACSSFKAVTETSWKNYNLAQPRGSLPQGPLVIMIHMASVWVPFTSESKEAIADYDEIRKEMKLALMEAGRKLGTYLRKRQKMRREAERLREAAWSLI